MARSLTLSRSRRGCGAARQQGGPRCMKIRSRVRQRACMSRSQIAGRRPPRRRCRRRGERSSRRGWPAGWTDLARAQAPRRSPVSLPVRPAPSVPSIGCQASLGRRSSLPTLTARMTKASFAPLSTAPRAPNWWRCSTTTPRSGPSRWRR